MPGLGAGWCFLAGFLRLEVVPEGFPRSNGAKVVMREYAKPFSVEKPERHSRLTNSVPIGASFRSVAAVASPDVLVMIWLRTGTIFEWASQQ